MPMLLLHVGWCLPLPIPSSKNCATYPKTHELPYLKTHNPHATLPKNSTKNSQPTCHPTQKLNKQLTTHTLPSPKNTPAKQCRLLPRSLDGSVVHAPTPMRMLPAATALCARPGAQSTMPLWLVLWQPQRQGQQEWIVASRLALLHWQQLSLLLPGRWLPPPMGLLLGRCLMPPMGHLLWRVVQPCTTGGLPNWGGDCLSVVACLVNTMVDIVGTYAKDRGCNCPFHACCEM